MNAKVTENGILIPKQWLEYVEEVEIRKENEIILVIPVKCHLEKVHKPLSHPTKQPIKPAYKETDDPIFNLGKHPIDNDLSDVSINHDKYIYG